MMSESLRDRVARVLNNEGAFCGNCGREPGDPIDHCDDCDDCDDCNQVLSRYVDALIAAGLVTECGEPPSTAFEVMATGHGLPIMLYHGAHDNPLRVRSWTHDGDRLLVEYVEVTS